MTEDVAVLHREVHGMAEAARLLGLRPARLRGWVDGYVRGGVTCEPVIRPGRTGSDIITWGEFVEAGYLREYRVTHGVSLQSLRPVVMKLRERLGVLYPLAHAKPYVLDHALVLEVQREAGLAESLQLVRVLDDQLVLTDVAEAFLRKVDFTSDDGYVSRLRPDERSPEVAMDPRRAFGAPAIGGVRTANIYELWLANESVSAIAAAFRIAVGQVEDAVRFEARAASSGAAAPDP